MIEIVVESDVCGWMSLFINGWKIEIWCVVIDFGLMCYLRLSVLMYFKCCKVLVVVEWVVNYISLIVFWLFMYYIWSWGVVFFFGFLFYVCKLFWFIEVGNRFSEVGMFVCFGWRLVCICCCCVWGNCRWWLVFLNWWKRSRRFVGDLIYIVSCMLWFWYIWYCYLCGVFFDLKFVCLERLICSYLGLYWCML